MKLISSQTPYVQSIDCVGECYKIDNLEGYLQKEGASLFSIHSESGAVLDRFGRDPAERNYIRQQTHLPVVHRTDLIEAIKGLKSWNQRKAEDV